MQVMQAEGREYTVHIKGFAPGGSEENDIAWRRKSVNGEYGDKSYRDWWRFKEQKVSYMVVIFVPNKIISTNFHVKY